MKPRSGLTYIIVNRRTTLVLDDPIDEGGSVNVGRLNQSDTQKVKVSMVFPPPHPRHSPPHLFIAVDTLSR